MPERAVIQIDFSGGTDERTDKRHVVPGKLTSLRNGVFEKSGSIRKRRGYTALSRLTVDGSTVPSAHQIAPFGNELVLTDGTTCYSFSETADRWTVRDDARSFTLDRTPITHGSVLVRSPDTAYVAGYLVTAWHVFDPVAVTHRVYVTVSDAEDGAKLFASYELAAGVGPRVVAFDGKAYVFYAANGGGAIRARTLDMAAPATWTTEVSVVTDAFVDDEFLRFDAVAATSTRMALVYTLNSGTNRVVVRTITGALATDASQTVSGTSGTHWEYSLDGDGAGAPLWLAAAHIPVTTVEVLSVVLNAVSLAVSSSAAIAGGLVDENPFVAVKRLSSSTAIVTWFENKALLFFTSIISKYQVMNDAGTALGSGLLYRHVWTSKPFVVAGRVYASAAYAHVRDATDSYGFVFELATSNVSDQVPREVARVAGGRLVVPNASPWRLSGVSDDGIRYWFPVNLQTGTTLGADMCELLYRAALSAPVELGTALHFAGGTPYAYDGARLVESTFPLPAETPFAVQQDTDAGNMANGTYNFVVVFARHDESGQVYRSAPCVPFEVVVSGSNPTSNFVNFQIWNLPFSRAYQPGGPQAQDVVTEVYMTKAGGETFFLVPSSLVKWGPSSADTTGYPINAPLLPYLYVEVYAGDADLDGQPLLYTTGGVLESLPAPAARLQVVHKDRLWLAGTDEPKIVWFSKRQVFREGIAFNPIQTIEVDDGGPVTALASLDAHLVIFKRDRIHVVDGDGPPDTGGEGFSPPQRLSADLGCTEPRSTALTPEGVFFQTSAGIYLLDRGLGLSYVSGPVEDTLAAYPVITSAVVHESQFHVRFSCTDSSGSSGVVLVLDYLTKQWSVFELYETIASNPNGGAVAACNFRGDYVWSAINGATYRESTTDNTDAGHWVTLSLETAWLKLADLQGWQRAWSLSLLGERFTPHDLTIEVANDYSDTYHQTKTWTDTAIAAMPLEQIKTAMTRQKCQAVRYRLTDATPTGGGAVGTGRGLSLTGFAIEAAVLPRTKRLRAAQRG